MIEPDAQNQATSHLNQELLAMVRIARTMLQYNNLEEILAAITKELSQVIAFDRSSVAFMSPDQQSLTLQHIYKGEGEADSIGEGRRIPIDEKSVIGWVVTHRQAVLRKDINADGRFFEVVQEEHLQCDMVVPLVARSEVIGTLNVGSYTPNAFSETDLEILENCGNLACGAIEHALLLKEAKAMSERYQTLQQHASDIIMLIDKNSGQLIDVNHKCCESLGYSEEELRRKSYFDLFPPEDRFQARRDFINILSRKSKSFVDRRLINRDGDIIFVDISSALITIKSDTFIQAMMHDISQRRVLEQQIVLQNKNLQQANKKLREVDRMKTEFLSNISHELRTPLSIIIAYSESMRESALSEEERAGFLDVIAENGEMLLRLINNLLDLSKLEVSDAMLNITLSHLHDVVRAMLPEMEAWAEEKGIDLCFNPGYEIPVIYFDNKRILQVMSCLITNAMTFTDAGGSVEVRTMRKEDSIWVQVVDNGVGIESDQLGHVFDAFRQIDGSSTRRAGGLGIGLAMAKHIVELHGGQIWVESEQNRGSVFTFALPIDTEEAFLVVPQVEDESSPAELTPCP